MSNYQYLDNLIFSYFNQDHDLGGDSFNSIVDDFNNGHSSEQRTLVKYDIRNFLADNTGNTEEVFSERYGFDVDPRLRGHSVKSFLEELLNRIS
jgi:hypothetical protein